MVAPAQPHADLLQEGLNLMEWVEQLAASEEHCAQEHTSLRSYLRGRIAAHTAACDRAAAHDVWLDEGPWP